MIDSAMDVLGYLIFATLLGSFTLWVMAYFAIELVKHVVRGPSPMLRSVGTSILEEPAFQAPVTPGLPAVPPSLIEEMPKKAA